MVLPLALAGVALGGLLGGSTSQQTTVTTTNSLQNAFNPVNNVSLGGGISSNPSGSVSGDPSASATATTAIAPPDAAAIAGLFGVPRFGGGGVGVSPANLTAGAPLASAPSSLFSTTNLLIAAAIGGAVLFLNKKG